MASKSSSQGVSGLLIALLCLGIYWVITHFGEQPPKPQDTNFPGNVDLPDNPDQLRIATFNIQVFGQATLKDEKTSAILARIIRQFDVVAVQELRSKEQNVVPEFLELVNADGGQYDALVSDRLGRTVSKEQYVYFYNRERVEVIDQPDPLVFPDPADELHREPYVARFRARGVPPEEAFSFILVNIHTDPDLVPEELAALAKVFPQIQKQYPHEDDVILLGDLNANNKKFSQLAELPEMIWVLTDDAPTNTAKNAQYDNILFHQGKTAEYIWGEMGVYDFPTRFELEPEAAVKVSDHMPVWAEFSIREK